MELWTSFRGVLRSYLAAGALGSEIPQAMLTESGPEQIQITGTVYSIALSMEAESGAGVWTVYRGADLLDEGAFRLHLDAEFEWSGKPSRMQMDSVAEALTIVALKQEEQKEDLKKEDR